VPAVTGDGLLEGLKDALGLEFIDKDGHEQHDRLLRSHEMRGTARS